MAAGDLTSLANAREYIQKVAGDTAQDTVISNLITRASKAIMVYTDREFAPVSAAGTTRRLQVSSLVVPFAPWDLNTIAANGVVLDPESSSPRILAATDYVALPVGKFDGVWTRLRLSSLLAFASNTQINMGFSLIDVIGTWGFPAIPADVEQACIDTVYAWMRGNVQVMSQAYELDTAIAPVSEPNLPMSARWKLKPYMGMAVG